jgi:hypothetical protein
MQQQQLLLRMSPQLLRQLLQWLKLQQRPLLLPLLLRQVHPPALQLLQPL